MIMLAFWIALATVLCLACSILEATLLSARVPKLLAAAKRGDVGAMRLAEIKRGQTSGAISAILTINTLAGTLGAGFAGVQAARLFGDAAVGLVSVLLTILLLIVAEIVPKTFAATHAMALSAPVGNTLFYLLKVMAPVVFLTRGITSRLSARDPENLTRKELAVIIAAAPNEGAISGSEAELLSSIVYAQNVTLQEVNTGADYVVMMDETTTIEEFVAADEAASFSRIPVYREDRGNVVGYALQRDVLRAAITRNSGQRTLADFTRNLPRLPHSLTIRAATDRLLHARESMGSVTDSQGKFIGIVTIEDLLEALTGLDITDEPDDVAAQRETAEIVRRKRVARLRRQTGRWVDFDR